jgi:hypothetical protein
MSGVMCVLGMSSHLIKTGIMHALVYVGSIALPGTLGTYFECLRLCKDRHEQIKKIGGLITRHTVFLNWINILKAGGLVEDGNMQGSKQHNMMSSFTKQHFMLGSVATAPWDMEKFHTGFRWQVKGGVDKARLLPNPKAK